jgi:hypothetical protein
VPAGKSGHTAAKRKAQENAVIKIIQKEWEREAERLDAKKNGPYAKNPQGKNYGDKSLVQSGHAEIESNRILYIYGNALEVLARSEFYDVVEEMHLTYVRFDLIVYHPNLDKLRKFTKLKKLVLSHNFLNSFILLSKIECIHSLDQLYIYDNEVLNTRALKSFIVYRFQHINEVSKINLSILSDPFLFIPVQRRINNRPRQKDSEAAIPALRQDPIDTEHLHAQATEHAVQ